MDPEAVLAMYSLDRALVINAWEAIGEIKKAATA